MKKYILLFLLLISCAPLKSGIVTPQEVHSTNQILLHIKVDEWRSYGKGSEHTIKEDELSVMLDKTFGPTQAIGIRQPPFRLLRIIDSNTITVQFDEGLTVLGEPVSKSYIDNPVTFSNELCFRTRTMDSGTDVCLRVV